MPGRKCRPPFSALLDRYRNLVERFFSKLNVATRFEKHIESLQPKSGWVLRVGELERSPQTLGERSGRSPTMIKMSVYYPADGGSTFDHDYYRTATCR